MTKAAAELLGTVAIADNMASNVLPEDIADIVKLHAKLGTAAALIPVPGLDVVASATAIWSMYIRINNELNLPFGENIVKIIASGVATNLAGYGIAIGIGSALKLIPGIGTIAGVTIMLGASYALLILSGWSYLKVLSIIASKNNGAIVLEQVPDEIKKFIEENKEHIKELFENAKNFYKSNKNNLALNEVDKQSFFSLVKNFQSEEQNAIEPAIENVQDIQSTFEMKKLSLCINMLKIDGEINENEVKLMEELIEKTKLEADQKGQLLLKINNSDFEKIDISEIKEDEIQRIAFVEALYNMAKIDQEIKPSEKIYFYSIAKELGFEKEEIQNIFDDI